MKKILFFVFVISGALYSTAQTGRKPDICGLGIKLNHGFSKARTLDSLMKFYTTDAMPGASIAVYSEDEGWWAGTAGYADIEKKVAMDNCHLQYLQSVSKTYMAVEILQLHEQGSIELEASITKYLPAKYSRYLKNPERITVRMLLNHTSGVPEYNENAAFVSQVIQHPLKNFTAIDCLKSIEGKDPTFTPGSSYKYINTNYLLLSLIGDAITGDHAAYIKKNIFEPLGLVNTYYSNGFNYLKGLHVPQSYWDVFNNGIPVNITGFQQMTVVSSKGDDGIVCTTTDAIKFLKGLMEGKLLKPGSMKEMLTFIKDEKGNNRYGMGIIYFDLGGIVGYGHGGGGVGAGCGLIYVPSRKLYVYFSTNLGVLIEGELVKKTGKFRDVILATLLQ